VAALSPALLSSPLEEQLQHYRNIKLTPDYEADLRDPFEILNMDKAVERILSAVKNNERIVVFGDYDADGVCATAIICEFFKKIDFKNFHVHIPDRHVEGYGLTLESMDEFKSQDAKLIIVLDCGVTDYEEVEKANKLGMDVVIIDHHLPPEKLPKAFAIVDPKQKKDKYPFKDLCGAGLAFKTVQTLSQKFEIGSDWTKWLLDLVAIASVADMVALIDENRTLVCYGLKVLKKTKRVGLISLFQRTGLSAANVNEDDIGFTISPRINVFSRMAHADMGFELLTTQSKEEADWITARMELLTADRKNLVEEILKEAELEIIKKEKIPEVIVAGNINWKTAVLGLIATRLVEKYNCPVFLWGKAEAKEIKASCRSDGTINLVELMKFLPEGIIFDFGGHAMSGGFSVKEEKIRDLEKEILKAYKKISKEKTENDVLYLDAEMNLENINEEFYGLIEKFQPFGIGNPKPVFLFPDIEIKNVRKFGNGGLHLQLDFNNISAIGFFIANSEKYDLKPGQKIDLAATLEKSFFRSTPELRLRIVDVKSK